MMRRLLLAAVFALVVILPAHSVNVTDSKSFSNISAATAGFSIKGGYYVCAAIATWGGGSVDFQALGPDASTWLALPTAVHFTANGMAAAGNLPPGQYRFNVTTATAVYVSCAAIPQ
jgi:hypothetical protein